MKKLITLLSLALFVYAANAQVQAQPSIQAPTTTNSKAVPQDKVAPSTPSTATEQAPASVSTPAGQATPGAQAAPVTNVKGGKSCGDHKKGCCSKDGTKAMAVKTPSANSAEPVVAEPLQPEAPATPK